jgi:type I restriction enzyme M protein
MKEFHQQWDTECFHVFSKEELLNPDMMSLSLFWLRDESLKGADALPAPEVLAASIVEDLQAALEQFAAIAKELGNGRVTSEEHVAH